MALARCCGAGVGGLAHTVSTAIEVGSLVLDAGITRDLDLIDCHVLSRFVVRDP